MMRKNDGAGAAAVGRSASARVAPRFTRAAQAERSRLHGRREQLLGKREEVEAELGNIDRAVGAIDELLELLAPLLTANGNEPEAAGAGSEATAEPAGPGLIGAEADGRDGAAR